ncbi:MAG: L,D-transpeptidase [Alphaproteobacteria bacterium]|nr:L,D-transpeptidase [Alphaproteobacteria bacterium]MDE2629401.1 L,D-transpeptidase [Alphaproteobacteria bacterium]
MRANPGTSALRIFSLAYLASATAFGVAIALHTDVQWGGGIRLAARLAVPVVRSAAEVANEKAVKPSVAWAVRKDKDFFAWLAQGEPRIVPPVPKKPTAQVRQAPALRPAIVEPPKTAAATAPRAPLELAPQETEPEILTPAPDANPPNAAELSRVLAHMKLSLTKELFDNFELFLYVSKADHGPWRQRMYVFQKQASGDLNLLYNFPVSTGREQLVANPDGRMLHTDTPQGYYEFDPDRMYRRYHSAEWGQSMPYAMFFSWEHDGLQTGLAIHGASGDDVALLGSRASAGCVRLAPQNAQLLFRLIRANYQGLAPRFAYDRRTATMANDGLLMHDKDGNLKYADGYKVLVVIENNGGDNVVAALF